MKRLFTSVIVAVVLIALAGGVRAYAAPEISFVGPPDGPTPDDGATIVGTSVEIQASITESALADVTFNWNGTNYLLYDESLVLMFNFDNVDALGENYSVNGSWVEDLSAAGNHGWIENRTFTYEGKPVTLEMPVWVEDGRYGGAFDFVGNGVDSGQSILVAHSDSLNPGLRDFAIAVWIQTRDDYDGDILRKGSTNTAGTWYKLEHSPSPNNNRLSLNFNTDGTDATVTSAAAYDDNQWHFVVAQRAGGYAELWIDGVYEGYDSISGSISNTADLAIGSKDTQADDFLNSSLDEVRIYMRSFTEDEIQELYYSNLNKYETDKWTLYVNQSNLTSGDYTYQASATNTSSQMSTAGPRSVTIDAPAVPPIPRKGPYLMYEGVNTEMTVLWQLDNSTTCTIEWGLSESYGNTAVTTEVGDHQHIYTITGLFPGTKYYYQVGGVGSGSFTAAPADGATSVKFMAYGDTRTNAGDHDAVNAQMINTYTTIDEGFQTVCLHVGDWVYSDAEYDWATEFFDPARTNTHTFQANMPINGCIGNHELPGTLFEKYWPYPYEPDGRYWSFDYGPAHIAIVDEYTDYSLESTQHTWLESDLATSNKQWKFIVLHEPGWSAGGGHGNNTAVQDYIHPLCLAYGVDIVFAGHNHYYARCDVDGVQYITTGGGGAPLRDPEMGYPYLVTAEKVLHFCEIDVQGNQLLFTARRVDGTVIESFNITDFQVTPSQGVTFSGPPGGPFVPAYETYTLSNNGDSSIDWTGTIAEPWLEEPWLELWFDGSSGNLVTGTISAGSSVDVDVYLTAEAASLEEGTYYDTITFTDTTNDTVIERDVTLEVIVYEDVANSDIPVKGTVGGSYVDTQKSDDVYERITERQSGGKPDNRYSYLEHKWTINVTGGNVVTFYVEAYHTSNSEGDDFVFAYSTDDSTYTNMLTVTKTSDDNTCQTYGLPGALSGTLYIRVTDSDQTQGNRTLDKIYVDHMYIRSEVSSNPPGQASDPDPPDVAMDVSINADLNWTAGAGAESHDVYFGTTNPPAFQQNQSGTIFDPGSLDNDMLYYWRIDENNSYGTTTRNVWRFTTKPGNGLSEIYVNDIAMSYKKAGPNYSGLATVWIKDDAGTDVEGATVYAEWSGAVSETVSGITGADGKVTLQSAKKKEGGIFTFTITNVVASGYNYNEQLNVETCDSVTAP